MAICYPQLTASELVLDQHIIDPAPWSAKRRTQDIVASHIGHDKHGGFIKLL